MTDNGRFKPKKDFTQKVASGRQLTKKVKTSRGRTVSSQRWLQRQLNDPYVEAAKELGYRSRAAFKLAEINEECKLLKPGQVVVDLGAAPGGWSQVAARETHSTDSATKVFGIDLLEVETIPGVKLLQGDFLAEDMQADLKALLPGPVDGVMSDMASSATGHRQTDHIKTMALAEMAFKFALQNLAEGGFFLAKVLRGGTEGDLLQNLKHHFKKVKHIKPPSSRKDSREMFVVAQTFKGIIL